MFSKKSKLITLSVITIVLSIALVGCKDDTQSAKDSKYFNIPWDMTTTEFMNNNPDVRFGQNNGVNAQTNEFSIELFDTGLYGKFSAYFITDKLISINVDVTEVMNSDSKEFMLSQIDEAFGETKYITNNDMEYMLWENSETTVTIYTNSQYSHMINKLYIEKKFDN